jgi:hypothetical protein
MKNEIKIDQLTRALRSLLFVLAFVALSPLLPNGSTAWARDINYAGDEVEIFVRPGEATQIEFPGRVEGGYKPRHAALVLEKRDRYMIAFAQPDIAMDGETIIVHLDDKRTFSLRLIPATEENPRDSNVRVVDTRSESVEDFVDDAPQPTDPSMAPRPAPNGTVAGLMREMVLAAEFGKQRGLTGYRRSNRYSGETILHDGALEARIDEIFMGSELWGYVVSVENMLETNQMLNPASFRLDGTQAVVLQRRELAARPATAEQQIANRHKAKVYIVTRSKRN